MDLKLLLSYTTRIVFVGLLISLFAATAFAQGSYKKPKFKDTPTAEEAYEVDKCYEKAISPTEYKVVTEKVKLSNAYTKYKYNDAVYDTIEIKELVDKGYSTYAIQPPSYDTVRTEVMIRPPSHAKPSSEWVVKDTQNTANDASQTFEKEVNNVKMEGEIVSAVAPAISGGELQMLDFEREIVPAIYKKMNKADLTSAGVPYILNKPPTYKVHKKLKMVRSAAVDTILIPAEYTTITIQKLVNCYEIASSKIEVICKDKVTPALIHKVQLALQKRGYDVGTKLSGALTGRTQRALCAFQKAKKLPIGNLNLWTLEELGVDWQTEEEDDSEDLSEDLF